MIDTLKVHQILSLVDVDFAQLFKLKIEEVPSIEIRDWLMNDILITLWESRPLFEKITEEGVTEESKERVVIDSSTNNP